MARLAILLATTMTMACSSDPYGLESAKRPKETLFAPIAPPDAPPKSASEQFAALEPKLVGKCGGCHKDGAYEPLPPQFLQGDTYATLRAYPGAVVEDPWESVLLTKGPHAGPGITPAGDLIFYNAVKSWLDAEALLILNKPWPSSAPVVIKPGPNAIDLSKACGNSVTGVQLLFDASLVGGMLSLSSLVLATPAGPDVRVVHLRIRRDGNDGIDEADSFSDLNEVFPNGGQTPVPPGLLVLSGESFREFALGVEAIRIEAEKIEPGTLPVIPPP